MYCGGRSAIKVVSSLKAGRALVPYDIGGRTRGFCGSGVNGSWCSVGGGTGADVILYGQRLIIYEDERGEELEYAADPSKGKGQACCWTKPLTFCSGLSGDRRGLSVGPR